MLKQKEIQKIDESICKIDKLIKELNYEKGNLDEYIEKRIIAIAAEKRLKPNSKIISSLKKELVDKYTRIFSSQLEKLIATKNDFNALRSSPLS